MSFIKIFPLKSLLKTLCNGCETIVNTKNVPCVNKNSPNLGSFRLSQLATLCNTNELPTVSYTIELHNIESVDGIATAVNSQRAPLNCL